MATGSAMCARSSRCWTRRFPICGFGRPQRLRLALVAAPAERLKPLLGTPTLVEESTQTFRIARLTPRVADRVALPAGNTRAARRGWRIDLVGGIIATAAPRRGSDPRGHRHRQRYTAMSRRLLASAANAPVRHVLATSSTFSIRCRKKMRASGAGVPRSSRH